jgi:hypothetical protein
MLFFRNSDGFEHGGNRIKSFFSGSGGKFRIHFIPFVRLTFGGSFQIFKRGADNTRRKCGRDFNLSPFQEFEQSFGMLFFLVGGFSENIGNLDISFLFGGTGKIGVTVSGLRLS